MRIAVVQCTAISDDFSETCEIILQHLRWAAEEEIDLLILPETFLLGHSYDSKTIRSRACAVSEFALAELCKRVADFRVTLVVGAFEIVGKQIFNSAFVIEGGQIVGRYSKTYPNEPDVTAGNDFPTFMKSGVRYGINICNDANHADAAEKIAKQGADLIVYPLNNMLPREAAESWRTKSLANLVERARQTGCWIASSDVTGTANSFITYGCSVIVAPDGQIVAGVPELMQGSAVYEVSKRQVDEMSD